MELAPLYGWKCQKCGRSSLFLRKLCIHCGALIIVEEDDYASIRGTQED